MYRILYEKGGGKNHRKRGEEAYQQWHLKKIE